MTQKRSKEQEIIEQIDKAINELVYEKTAIIKAYNYYHGRRDPEQFRHLEENYGIGTPTSVEFVPLVKKHIDVLIGEYISTPVMPKISCKDKNTISSIDKAKKTQTNNALANILKEHLAVVVHSKVQDQIHVLNQKVEKELNDLKTTMDANFISDYGYWLLGQYI
jgi:hypothetical protein